MSSAWSSVRRLTLRGGSSLTTASPRPPTSRIRPRSSADALNHQRDLRVGLAGLGVDDLESEHEAGAPGFGDVLVLAGHALEPRARFHAHRLDVIEDAVAMHDLQECDTGGEGQVVAAERSRVRSRLPGVERFVVEDDRDRQAEASERLGGDDHVGNDAVLLEGEPATRAATAALNLIDDQRNLELAGDPSNALEKVRRRWNHPAFALHDLEDHRRRSRHPAVRIVQRALEILQAALPGSRRVARERAPKPVGEGEEVNARHPVGDRLLLGDERGYRHRAVRTPVVGTPGKRRSPHGRSRSCTA